MLKWAACAFLVLSASAHAQNSKPADVWFTAAHIELDATGAGVAAEWQFDRADNGDVRLTKRERRPGGNINGTLLSVCEDRALAFKDILPARGRELMEINEPVLHLQLALRLLARAMPAGIPAAGSDIPIDLVEDKNTLRLRKAYSARKDIGAPWRVRGTARRTGEDVRFELAINYTGDDPPHPRIDLKLAGLWSRQTRGQTLDNALRLAGWRIHRVDNVAELVAGNTVVDLAANPTPLKFETLGELRAAIGRNWNPNVKAARVNECNL